MGEKVEIIIANNEKLMNLVWDVRHTVFTIEQGIPAEDDRDGADGQATNILLNVQDEVAGAGRLIIKDSKGILARIAVLKKFRGKGHASTIITALEKYGEKVGVNEFELYPHEYLEKLYQRLGYSRDPDYSFNVAGYNLIRMCKFKKIR